MGVVRSLKVALTGKPGSGKSTVVRRVSEVLQSRGWKVGGMVSPETRVGGQRSGFEIVDLLTGRKGLLATLSPGGPRVGRYFVKVADIDEIGVAAIKSSLALADLTVIDEIGPMELKSQGFRECIEEALASDKNILAVVHWTMAGNIRLGEVHEVTKENRARLVKRIVDSLTGGD